METPIIVGQRAQLRVLTRATSLGRNDRSPLIAPISRAVRHSAIRRREGVGAGRPLWKVRPISLPLAPHSLPRSQGGRVSPPLGAILIAAASVDIARIAADRPSTDRSQVASQAVERPVGHLGNVVGLTWRTNITP